MALTGRLGYSVDEVDRRIADLVARERERTGKGHVTVRWVAPRKIDRKPAKDRPNKTYLKGGGTGETDDDRRARELRQLRVRLEEARDAL